MTTTLSDQIDPFIGELKRRRFSANTRTAYQSDLRLAARYLTAPLDQITLDEIEAFLGTSSAAATAARRAASLKRFFAWAKKQGLCAVNPLADREPERRAPQRLPRPIESQRDLAAIDAEIARLKPPFRLIFTILRETGMRVSEVLALNLSDVLLEPGREGLRVREPKNDRERIAPLGPNATPRSLRGLRAWIKELRGEPGHVPLFRSNRGTRVTYAAAQYQWSQLCTRAGLVEVTDGASQLRYTLHQLRHTRGTELVRQGHSMEVVQRVLGHRDIRSTQGYAELNDEQVREALEARRHQ